MKLKLTILISIALIIAGSAFWSYFQEYGIAGISTNKIISGTVSDCTTGERISNAEISLFQSGFGIDQAPLYKYKTNSDSIGNFKISWKIGGAAHIFVNKEDYLQAEQNEKPGKNIVIKLLKVSLVPTLKVHENTNYCKPISDCTISEIINGVKTYKNICSHY